MKKILLFILALGLFSCTNETTTTTDVITSNNITSKTTTATKGSLASTSNFSDYGISVSVSPDGSLWTYTITKSKTSAKTLSHFIISLDNCGENSATFSDVISATINGVSTDISNIEGSGTGCNPQETTTNFIKFPSFSAANSWTIVIQFDRGYETFNTSAAWIKAGSSCNQGTVAAPGCPKEDRCSFSQGYFFSNGTNNNGASVLWVNGLTIGGVSYTKTEGMNLWDLNNGKGKDTTLNAFFQLGAVRLSGAESEVTTYATIIDAYFNGINAINSFINGRFVLPDTAGGYTKDQVKAAGSAIGSFIDANHCP
ncbi:MAG: hypothetical protein RLZZ540_188 [Bacteroidota bacterium]|jgi:hypothetical protein